MAVSQAYLQLYLYSRPCPNNKCIPGPSLLMAVSPAYHQDLCISGLSMGGLFHRPIFSYAVSGVYLQEGLYPRPVSRDACTPGLCLERTLYLQEGLYPRPVSRDACTPGLCLERTLYPWPILESLSLGMDESRAYPHHYLWLYPRPPSPGILVS
jgi:hypothetical protein